MRIEQFGDLRARVTGGTDREGGGDGPVVVLLHGFGAPGDDLVPLWRVIDAPTGTRFVFPEAPLSLAEIGYLDGRAWWHIDMQRMMARLRAEGDGPSRVEVPAGLETARAKVLALLDAVTASMRPSKLVLGGFSQGAMLSCDVALRSDVTLAGLVLLSGALICEPEWVPLMARRQGVPVFQTHGEADALLPFSGARALREHFVAAGADVTWVPFRGGHEIPPVARDELGKFLRRVL